MTPIVYSANLGFLWTELPFAERLRAAAAAGFPAVEFHDQAQGEDLAALSAVLAETGLEVTGLNVRGGETAGCAAIPGEEARFDAEFAEALRAANAIDAGAIHVLAGRTADPAARDTFVAALRRAADLTGRTLLIEPICREAVADYFLHDLDQAGAILAEVDRPNVRIMFDCFHIAHAHGDCLAEIARMAPLVGHVQIASVPDRTEPDHGTLDMRAFLRACREAGYEGRFGCEYRPRAGTEAGLGWMRACAT